MKTNATLLRRAGGVLIAVLIGAGAIGSPAAAAPSGEAASHSIAKRVLSASDPKAAFEKLGVKEQELFKAATTVAYAKDSDSSTASRPDAIGVLSWTGCWSQYHRRDWYNIWGSWMYGYWQTTQICVSTPGVVNAVSVYNMGADTDWTKGYSIDGSASAETYNVGWEGRGRSQQVFKYGGDQYGNVKVTRCIQTLLNSNGVDSRWTESCDTRNP